MSLNDFVSRPFKNSRPHPEHPVDTKIKRSEVPFHLKEDRSTVVHQNVEPRVIRGWRIPLTLCLVVEGTINVEFPCRGSRNFFCQDPNLDRSPENFSKCRVFPSLYWMLILKRFHLRESFPSSPVPSPSSEDFSTGRLPDTPGGTTLQNEDLEVQPGAVGIKVTTSVVYALLSFSTDPPSPGRWPLSKKQVETRTQVRRYRKNECRHCPVDVTNTPLWEGRHVVREGTTTQTLRRSVQRCKDETVTQGSLTPS